MKIVISGMAGAGKSTIGKALSETLCMDFFSAGSFARKYAKINYGLDINSFQLLCKLNPYIDKQIDDEILKLCSKSKDIILDYRLGPKFLDDALNIYLQVSEKEAYGRINKANRTGEKTSLLDISKRNNQMRKRFIKKYNFDFSDLSHYDLIINTEKYSIQEITRIIKNKIINDYNFDENPIN